MDLTVFLPRDARQSATATASRLSVRNVLSYRDHIGWNTSKIISRVIRPGYVLFVNNITDLFQKEHP